MKRFASLFVLILLLSGCTAGNSPLESVISLRQQLLSAKGCRFSADITADYGDELYAFSLDCQADEKGGISFEVTAPETLSGITGRLSETGGELTFSDTGLAFDLMADDLLSPVSAPWVFLNTLRGGYIRSAGEDGGFLWTTIDDSYREDALQLDIWLNDELLPVRCEILHEGRRFLSMDVKGFRIL